MREHKKKTRKIIKEERKVTKKKKKKFLKAYKYLNIYNLFLIKI